MKIFVDQIIGYKFGTYNGYYVLRIETQAGSFEAKLLKLIPFLGSPTERSLLGLKVSKKEIAEHKRKERSIAIEQKRLTQSHTQIIESRVGSLEGFEKL